MATRESKELAADHQRLLRNMKLIQRLFSVSELADVLEVSKPTWIAKMKEPWARFSYDDFSMIARYCGIDLIQLMTGELTIKG